MESSVEDMRAAMLEWADAQESLLVEISDQLEPVASAEVSAPVPMPAQASSSLSEVR
jgi:hypothetical protein